MELGGHRVAPFVSWCAGGWVDGCVCVWWGLGVLCVCAGKELASRQGNAQGEAGNSNGRDVDSAFWWWWSCLVVCGGMKRADGRWQKLYVRTRLNGRDADARG